MTKIEQITGPPSPIGPASRDTRNPAASEFSQVMSSLVSDTVSALKSAETTSAKALDGTASIQQVVDSMMQAERHLQTVLAVRDKIVAAYLEINRTSI